MRHIVVPCDFSDSSYNAIKSAVEIAKKNNSRIIILNTYQKPASQSSSFIKIVERMKELSNEELSELKQKIDKEGLDKDSNFIYVSLNTSLNSGIKIISQKYDVYLIVMGLTGASGLKEIFVGSNALKVIKHSTIPVLSIPINASIKNLKKAIFATDFELDVKSEKIKPVLDLCRDFDVEIDFVFIHNKDFNVSIANRKAALFFDNLSEHLQGIKYNELLIEDKSIFSGVNRIYEQEEADLIILIKKTHSFVEKLFTREVTSRIVLDAKLPLLTIHE